MYMIGQTISSLPIGLNSIDNVKLENGIYDELYARGIDEKQKDPAPLNNFTIPKSWEYGTRLHAKFNGDLYSGNPDFSIKNTTNIIVKRREEGSFKWMPIFDIPVSELKLNNYKFEKTDKYASSGVTYEYAAVPIIRGDEGNYSVASCDVKFDTLVIMDMDETYSTMYDIEVSQDKNNTSSVIMPITARYPIYVANASNDYFTGQVSATFLNLDCKNPDPSEKEIQKYRKKLLEFLNNRNVKFIKDPQGRAWLAVLGTTISDAENGHPYLHKISFDFTEVGNVESNEDMNRYGFLNIGEEWWN